jgi:hypothetical protein
MCLILSSSVAVNVPAKALIRVQSAYVMVDWGLAGLGAAPAGVGGAGGEEGEEGESMSVLWLETCGWRMRS